MNTFIKLSILASSLVFATSCTKTETRRVQNEVQKTTPPPEQKVDTKAEADRAMAELTASLQQLRSNPDPTPKWSDDELNAYADQLEANERGLNKLKGYPEAYLQGETSIEESRRMINLKRALLQEARETRAEVAVIAAKEMRVGELINQFEKQTRSLNGEGLPIPQWSEEKMDQYEAGLAEADKTIQELESLAGASAGTEARRATNGTRRNLMTEARKK